MQLHARIAAPASAVWRYLTDPALHYQWSLATMRILSLGDQDVADGIGAYRSITVKAPTVPVRMFEVIEHAEPPARLVYRVTRGPQQLRRHRGEIRLVEEGGGTSLAWRVDLEFAVPGGAAISERLLEDQVGRSLRALERVADGAPAAELVMPRAYRDEPIESLIAATAPLLAAPRALAGALAEVYLDHFAARCDYARFRADYLLMAPIFRGAADRLLGELPASAIPLSIRVAKRLLPPEVQDALTNRRGYDVPVQRLEAFERGDRLARWAASRR